MKKLNLLYVAACIVAICAISAFTFKAETYTSADGVTTLASLENTTKSLNGCSYYEKEEVPGCWYDSDQGSMEWVCETIAGVEFCDWAPVMTPTPGVNYRCSLTSKESTCDMYDLECHPYQ